MRTKNAKRLWPVPATLAVMAVAALLAFGLMPTNGAQPAAAQQKADCTVTLDANNTEVTADACTAIGDTAIVEFVGNTGQTEDVTLSILIADRSGPISAYPNGTTYTADLGFQFESDDASPAKYRYQTVELAEAAPDSQGIVQPAKVRVTVPGNVLIWIGTDTSVTSPITDAPNDERQVTGAVNGNAPEGTLTITFLGMPALGKDLDTDHNTKLDDEILAQCYLTTDNERMRVVMEGDSATNCPLAHTAVNPPTDEVETRSKLVVRTGEADETTGTAQAVYDGTEVTHTVEATDMAVTIYALVQDAMGQNLLETPVDFTATTNPPGIISDRELSDDPETATVVTGNAGDDEILVGGLDTPGADVPVTAEIDAGDAVASFTLDELDEIKGAFSITVNVMAGSLDLGTVIITRPNVPATLHAGIFTIDCFTKEADATDYVDALFDMDKDDCEAMGMFGRFGREQMVVVKAHLEDTLGNVVGVSDDLDAEFANEDDDLIGDGDVTTIEDPVENKIMPRAWVYTIDKDATLGDHMITVSTTAQNADDEDIDEVTVTVSVAGPPVSLSISGDANIELNGFVTYTVTAEDMKNGIPYFDRDSTDGTDRNDMVTVSVQPTEALVIGTNTAGQVMLDDDGTADFIVYAALDADNGDHGRIIARLGELQDIELITFGDPDATPDPMETDEFTADYTVDATSPAGSGMVDVSWTRSDGLSLSLVSLIQGDKVVDFKITGLTSTDFSGVDPGEYDVSVFSFRITEDGEKDGEIAFGTVTVE